ncbi:hypothetical protein PR048_023089 [Dryococelus australis]|uniref:Uncharacterized protein n=1 Tax=Dryococelus australis TaxID=614101 RepID=A0ABQ9GT38_9NEOP|nr:hypothetical protein PR048_023089 [Dryococelus australis]
MLRPIFARSWRHGSGKTELRKLLSVQQWRKLSSATELTAERYPNVKRGNYNVLSDSHIQFFESILGRERVLTDTADVEPYNVDWLKMVRG